ncbi:AraC-type DNA-binding protein [Flavobacterium resistens]|uniref:AraC-type DNA-binding protein n=1 Tax=Flavobacterium resistens TaxID=443612 RepID=A0A521EZF4_9FLAO|nr:helix-turn-helix domain-containing protein [Flavobacterium resistens]MRX69338.1 helix-turn-helix domain-containing protein [Flavobacterium resistens]SMO89328.1 AraC-type DNA-binding protein [Flavobacterium resistens]
MALNKLFNFSLVLLFPFLSFSQTSQKDLTKLSYKELNNLYFDNENNPKKQILFTNAYMAKAKRENNNIAKARGNYQIALLYYLKDENKAISYLDSVIKYSKNTNDKFFPAAAYCEKADFLKKQFKFKEAMDNYNLAEKIALQTNVDYYYVVREYIGITKSEDLGEYNEALAIYKECYDYYKTKEYRTDKYANNFQDIIFGIADCYKSLQNTDSTTYYNKLGFKESTITNNVSLKYVFVLNEGANQVLKKNYHVALDSINKALPQMIKYNDVGNTLAAYFYLGKAYSGIEKKDIAAKNYLKVDSIYSRTKEITAEFIDGYPFLINYYKSIGDKEKQLNYISKYMIIDSVLHKNYRNLNKLVRNEYDIPHLMSEKESIIYSLKKNNLRYYWGIGVLLLVILTVSIFGFYQFNLKKKYRSRFEQIMDKSSEKKNEQDNPDSIQVSTVFFKKDNIGIAEELITEILEKLNDFEKAKGFLKSDITIQNLSSLFETNSKYLSKIVNTYRDKTFIQYINDLRVEDAIENLKKDSKLRKYTVHALALEFGFNSAESFSAAFFKKSGIKPTYFIKQLEDLSEYKKLNNN